MLKSSQNKRTAFSLIELSVVLIVIGLLIAGITGGASLIRGSELRAVSAEARGYGVAVRAFHTQYNSLPGDFDKAVFNAANDELGDNDSLIQYLNSSNKPEGLEAWKDLFAIGAILDEETYTTTSAAKITQANAGSVLYTQIPSSKLKNSGWVFDNWPHDNQNAVLLIHRTTAAASTGMLTADSTASAGFSGTLTPADAFSIDEKLDDGSPVLGDVRAQSGVTDATRSTGGANSCHSSANGAASPAVGGTYDLASVDRDCVIAFSVNVID
jgi:prepilin-type N-terminal cleavage/methylation domain-containing protein